MSVQNTNNGTNHSPLHDPKIVERFEEQLSEYTPTSPTTVETLTGSKNPSFVIPKRSKQKPPDKNNTLQN